MSEKTLACEKTWKIIIMFEKNRRRKLCIVRVRLGGVAIEILTFSANQLAILVASQCY